MKFGKNLELGKIWKFGESLEIWKKFENLENLWEKLEIWKFFWNSIKNIGNLEKQERDAHRCDRVKVFSYTNSLRAFKKLISGLTWSYTHYQDLAPPLSNFCCAGGGVGLGFGIL